MLASEGIKDERKPTPSVCCSRRDNHGGPTERGECYPCHAFHSQPSTLSRAKRLGIYSACTLPCPSRSRAWTTPPGTTCNPYPAGPTTSHSTCAVRHICWSHAHSHRHRNRLHRPTGYICVIPQNSRSEHLAGIMHYDIPCIATSFNPLRVTTVCIPVAGKISHSLKSNLTSRVIL